MHNRLVFPELGMATVFSDYEDRRARRISVVFFLLITLVFLGAFNFIPVPSQEFADRKVEVLMLEQMIFESFEDLGTLDDEESAEKFEPEEREEAAPGLAEENATEDLEQLLTAFGDVSFSEVGFDDTGMTESARFDETPSILDQGELEVESGDVANVFGGRSLDLTSDLVKRDDERGRATRSLRPGLLSERVSGQGRPGSRRITGSGSGDSAGLDLRSEQRGTANLLKPTRTDLEPKEREIEFSIPTDALVEWMRMNQNPLDPGIRSHFRYSSREITSKELISVGGRSYGLQLMHSPGGGATHIALLEGNTIFYFIDPGRQQRANYFQKGTTRRDEETLVILVESEDLSPRSEEARHFFEIFLAWWAEIQEGL